jgi:phosphatidate cytidylyltransferase
VKERILTALVLFAVVVGVLFFDPTGIGKYVLFALAALLVAVESAALLSLPSSLVVIAACVWLAAANRLAVKEIGAPVVVLLLGLLFFQLGNAKRVTSLSFYYWSGILGAWFAGFLGLISTSSSFPLILTAAIPIWAGDTAAIFAGRAFGKHKLAPSISPHKTWEGSVANLLAAVGAAATLGYFLKYPMDIMLLLGVSCGVIGQFGDLFESYLKRQAGVKDSGNLLPGHGGVFDRLDSLLMTAPFSYWILSSFLK